MFKHLTVTEFKVVDMRYCLSSITQAMPRKHKDRMTLKEIAEKRSCSPETIRKILARAMAKMKRAAYGYGYKSSSDLLNRKSRKGVFKYY